jgi:hypothetical protein
VLPAKSRTIPRWGISLGNKALAAGEVARAAVPVSSRAPNTLFLELRYSGGVSFWFTRLVGALPGQEGTPCHFSTLKSNLFGARGALKSTLKGRFVSPSILGAQETPVLKVARDVTLSSDLSSPGLSLQGMLAVTLEQPSGSKIRIIDFNSSRVLEFQSSLPSVGSPAFSPDGSALAFVGTSSLGEDLFWSRWDRVSPQQITSSAREEGNPSWAPDSSSLLYYSELTGQPNRREVFRATFPGGQPVPGVAASISQITAFGGRNTTPIASPLNQTIAYSTDRFWPGWDVCFFNQSTGLETCPMGNTTETFCRPAWSPDGTRVVISRGEDDDIDLALYTIGTQSLELLTNLPHKEYDGTWSPDGNFIAFAHNPSGGNGYMLKVLRLSDRQIFNVAQVASPGSLRYLSWGEPRPYAVQTQDLCPSDPLKVVPGYCGCGMPDIDSDGDARPDCVDLCPQDAGVWEGECPVTRIDPTPTPIIPQAPKIGIKRPVRGAVSLIVTAPRGLVGPFEFSIQLGKRTVRKTSARSQVKTPLKKDILARASVRGAQTDVSGWSAWKKFKLVK